MPGPAHALPDPLGPHLPALSGLQLLRDAVALGSIGAAGERAGISQQAASQRLRAVEAQVGAVLLHRSPRGVSATPTGAVVTEWAERLLAVAVEVDAAIAGLRTTAGAHLAVAASMTVAEHLLPRWLVALRAQHAGPGQTPATVTLTATNSTAVADAVRAERADLGFVEGPHAPADLPARTIATDELVVVVAPDHPWTHRRRPLTAADLAAAPLVAREAGSGTRAVLDEALAAAGAPAVSPVLELTTSTAVRESVRAGGAAAVLSRLAVQVDLDAGRLRAVPVAGLHLRRQLRALWPGGAMPPAGPARDLLTIAAGAPMSPADDRGLTSRTSM